MSNLNWLEETDDLCRPLRVGGKVATPVSCHFHGDACPMLEDVEDVVTPEGVKYSMREPMPVEAELAANRRRAAAGRHALIASVAHGGADLGEDLETIATDTVANILHCLDVRADYAHDLLNRAVRTYLGDQEEL